ncbi:hypothetical protein [Lachnospira multipara]|uniref:hypothetical protein n=1 Tax=Lachnospira multipara TaxID=28051 RepID=UPI0012DDA801|nr:hypothetical protein [Lachnospira multipara]
MNSTSFLCNGDILELLDAMVELNTTKVKWCGEVYDLGADDDRYATFPVSESYSTPHDCCLWSEENNCCKAGQSNCPDNDNCYMFD